jgi:uncharacterized oligopeptide transporter (OPT) family protein
MSDAPPLHARPTLRCLLSGMVLAIVLCAMNSFLTLSFGVIEEGPTIAALFFFAGFALSRTRITTSEMVIVSTMGSAGGSLGFISNFFAAKVMTGPGYTLGQMSAFCVVTSLLGMLAVIPLRELLVVREQLPWPGSKAVAAIISALVEKPDRRQAVILAVMTVFCIGYVVANNDGGYGLVPAEMTLPVFGLAAYGAGLALSPFALAGSYLMGLRTCVGFLTGGLLLLVLAPRLPDPSAPHRYVWPGIGFLLGSGLTMMGLNWRMLRDSFRSMTRIRGPGSEDESEVILRGRGLALFAALVLAITFAFSMGAMGLGFGVVVVLILLGGFVQNVIATRAAAMTAFNPARVMGVLMQGVCALLGARSAALNLTGAGFVAGSGAQAGVLIGDMAYGRWFKVPPRWQFWAQMATILPCSVVSAFVFQSLHARTPLRLDGGQIPAPVAKIWATTALIFDGQQPLPPYALQVLLLAGLLGGLYVVLEEKTSFGKWLPSSVGLGIGLVLPVSIDLSFFLGGFVLWVVLGRWFKVSDVTLTTIAVAAIVGEGIGGVLKPLLDVAGLIPH